MKNNQAVDTVANLINNSDLPSMLILIGVPGVGKSTFINKLRDQCTFIVGSTDDLIEERAIAAGKTYSEIFEKINFKYITKEMIALLEAAIDDRTNVIVDRTNMSKKSRQKFIGMAQKPEIKYKLIALNFSVDDKVLYKRLDHRAETTGKFIPVHVIKNMFNNYECPTRIEGFDHIIEIDNT